MWEGAYEYYIELYLVQTVHAYVKYKHLYISTLVYKHTGILQYYSTKPCGYIQYTSTAQKIKLFIVTGKEWKYAIWHTAYYFQSWDLGRNLATTQEFYL